MLFNYIIYLLIFLLLLLFITHLSDMSLYKIITKLKGGIKEGLDECSQGEKDELYRQKMKINAIMKQNTTINNKIRYLERKVQENVNKNKANVNDLKKVSNTAKGSVDKQSANSKNVKF